MASAVLVGPPELQLGPEEGGSPSFCADMQQQAEALGPLQADGQSQLALLGMEKKTTRLRTVRVEGRMSAVNHSDLAASISFCPSFLFVVVLCGTRY